MPKEAVELHEDVVDAHPTKRFFVEMLTRDIDLEDAVLDLLDNCLDGVLRHTEPAEDDEKPYAKFWAKIEFSKSKFKIADNCGGIDRQLAVTRAFRMGRPKDDASEEALPTVGVYGIGMKRAIFKMGRSATVSSRTKDDAFKVSITPRWLLTDGLWELPIEDTAKVGGAGTTIEVTDLYKTIGARFGDQLFAQTFAQRVATHYSLIIHKGFKVTVNDEPVTPTPMKFLLSIDSGSKRGIAPFLYEGEYRDVTISLAVGFIKATPTADDLDEEQQVKHSRNEAGWTVVCNDRVVLYCDQSRLTGWGEAGVPSFHAQFMAIAGIIHFRSTDAIRLPVTTTKRGIDASSDIYLFAKNYMRRGMKIFTQYTYKLKDPGAQERERVRAAPALELGSVRKQIPEKDWEPIKTNKIKERQFIPDLPSPPPTHAVQNMRFSRPPAQIRRVSQFIFGEKDRAASEVGAGAFDWVHEKAKS